MNGSLQESNGSRRAQQSDAPKKPQKEGSGIRCSRPSRGGSAVKAEMLMGEGGRRRANWTTVCKNKDDTRMKQRGNKEERKR